MKDPDDVEFQRLVAQAMDDALSSQDAGRFQELARGNRDRLEQLVDHALIASLLTEEGGSESVADLVDLASGEMAPPGKKRKPGAQSWKAILPWGIAAALVLVAGAGSLFWPSGESETAIAEPMDDGVAVVARSVGARWKGASLLPYDPVPPGHWELLEGVVELEFYSGASVILEAPAALEIFSENGGTLHYGKLRALVPVQAQGFTIRTREIELVDLGTEFAMEVTEQTGTAVHVLDGKVELFAHDESTRSSKELLAGQGQLVAPSGRRSEITPDPDRFVSRAELARRVREMSELTHQRWQAASARLRENPRLLAYYDFQPLPEQERILPNRSPNRDPGLDGAIVGARWKWGRWREMKRALDFKGVGDRVLINVPGSATSITLVAWVRLDRLDRPYNVLLASREWNRPGAVHWRIQNSGLLQLQVNNGLSQPQFTSPAPLVMQPGDFHRWMSLVAVYDGESGTVSQYRNGILLGVSKLKKIVPLAIGKAEIANWTGSGKGSRQVRYFNGRFGELIIFNKALSASEIAELHRNGNKYE